MPFASCCSCFREGLSQLLDPAVILSGAGMALALEHQPFDSPLHRASS